MVRPCVASGFCQAGGKSWTRKFEQVDKWSFCLIAAMIAANRRDYEQKTAPEPHTGFQGQGGACRHQGRSNVGSTGGAFRRPPQLDYTWKAQLEGGASDVFGSGSTAPSTPAVDVK